MSDLYDADVLAWSEQQAELLRRRSANALDWDNIAEEIADVGNEQRHAAESLLVNILSHLLQIAAWPDAGAVPGWRHEVTTWRVTLARRLRRAPSLEAALPGALAELYVDARTVMHTEIDGIPLAAELPDTCPWSWEQVIAPTFWPDAE